MKKICLMLATVMLSGTILASCGNEAQSEENEKGTADSRIEDSLPTAEVDTDAEGNDIYRLLRMDMDLISEQYSVEYANDVSGDNRIYKISSPAITVYAPWDGEATGVKPAMVESEDESVSVYPGISVGMSAADVLKAEPDSMVANVISSDNLIRLTYDIDDYYVSIYVSVDASVIENIDPNPGEDGSYNFDAEKDYLSNPTGTVTKVSVTRPTREY